MPEKDLKVHGLWDHVDPPLGEQISSVGDANRLTLLAGWALLAKFDVFDCANATGKAWGK